MDGAYNRRAVPALYPGSEPAFLREDKAGRAKRLLRAAYCRTRARGGRPYKKQKGAGKPIKAPCPLLSDCLKGHIFPRRTPPGGRFLSAKMRTARQHSLTKGYSLSREPFLAMVLA